MALFKAISPCSPTSLAFLPPKRESFLYNERVYGPRILSSFPELAARTSELHGHAVAATSNTGNFTKSRDNQVIRAVLQSEREVEVSGSIHNGGFRGKFNKVVLAYSGGLDTSVIVPWLRENYGCDVVCFTADVGQGIKELEGLEKKAKASGASQLVVKDLREEFVRDFIYPCLRAGAVYERKYLLGTSMARPVIAKAMVDVANEVGADAVSHGCTGKGNDQVRFELTFFALNPKLNVVAPWREWDITGREDAIEYAKKHKVPVPVTKRSIYSRDRNLWHLSHEGDILEDPRNEPMKDMYMLTVDPQDAPNKPEYVEIGIESGLPVSFNGKKLSPASLLAELNEIGGRHGIGRENALEVFTSPTSPHSHTRHSARMSTVKAVALISGDNNIRGSLHFVQNPCGSTHVKGRITGLSPGLHGFHIHALGDTTNGCNSTGPHFNPLKKYHGSPIDKERHAGDLGNIVAGPNGVAEISIKDDQILLSGPHSILGRAVVVHADPDDLGRGGHELSKSTGNAGARVGCGIIGLQSSV